MAGFIVSYRTEYLFIPILFFGTILIGFFLIHSSAPQSSNFLLSVFLTGYLLRILLSLLLYFYSSQFGYFEGTFASEGFFIGDGLTYFSNGRALSELWRAGIFPSIDAFRLYYAPCPAVSMYDFFNGFIIWLTSAKTPLVFFFLNSLFDSLSIVLIYLITVRLIGEEFFKYARYAAVLYCFWPSMILWSTQNLKEPICNFLVYVAILSMLNLVKKFDIWRVFCLLSATYILSILRLPMAVSVAAIFPLLYFVLIIKAHNKAFYLLATAILLAIFLLALKESPIFNFIKELTSRGGRFDISVLLKNLDTIRSARAFGKTAVFSGFEYTDVTKLLFFIPIGIIIVFFMPFPWQLGSAMQIMALPETLVFYALLPFTIGGFIYALKKNKAKTVVIASYILVMAIILGLSEGNVGTLFRHRSVIFALCLVFAGIGMGKQMKLT